MNQALFAPKGMTAEEYLVWQETQLERYDFYNGEVFAMSGGTDAHNTVTLNAAVELKNHLKGTPCRVFMSDVQLQLSSASHYAYPDVFVTCDPRDKTPESSLQKQFPCLIIEVLSPSTSDYDQGIKFDAYRAIQTVQEVLFIQVDRRTAMLYQRSTSPQWLLTPATLADTLSLKSVGLELAVAAFFEGLDQAQAALNA